MSKGKAYANRRPKRLLSDLRASDFYPTPKCLVKEFLKQPEIVQIFNNKNNILEPACGEYAISSELENHGIKNVVARDLRYGNDFLLDNYSNEHYDIICSNFPFSLWNEFVEKSKTIAPIVITIGKLNFFGAHDRNKNNLWKHLKYVFVSDRQIAYDQPEREDGLAYVGMLVTGWFVWDMSYEGDPMIKIMDMDKYIYRKSSGKKDVRIKTNEDSFEYEGKIYVQKDLDFPEVIKED